MVIKVVRSPARKIDFKNQELVEPPKQTPKTKPAAKYNKPIEPNKEIYKEIDSITKNLEEKEKLINQKEKDLEKMAVLWTSLNDLKLEGLKQDEIKKITLEQKGFIKDLLEHYIKSEEKQKLLEQEIQRTDEQKETLKQEIQNLKEKPWAGKGASEIEKENKELKQKIKELEEQIQWV